jgi:hypothetical protein
LERGLLAQGLPALDLLALDLLAGIYRPWAGGGGMGNWVHAWCSSASGRRMTTAIVITFGA